MSMAMRACSMPLWHFVSNAEVEVLVAGEEDTRPITANLLVSPAAGGTLRVRKNCDCIGSPSFGLYRARVMTLKLVGAHLEVPCTS